MAAQLDNTVETRDNKIDCLKFSRVGTRILLRRGTPVGSKGVSCQGLCWFHTKKDPCWVTVGTAGIILVLFCRCL